jgi:hypothetical protein
VLLLLLAAGAGAATRTSAFSDADPGVRPSAMGGAFTAVGGEPIALYWNPASLFFQTDRGIEASYTDLYGLGLARRSYLTFGIKTLIDEPRYEGNKVVVTEDRESGAAYAIGLQSLWLDLEDNGYSEFSIDGGASWGYGDRLVAGLSLSGLFVSSDLDDVSAYGYNVGLGLIWRITSRENLAISVPHLFSRLFWKFDSDERLPFGATVGWSGRFRDNLLFAADIEWQENEQSPYRIAGGGEWWIFGERIALRAGYRYINASLESLSDPTLGVGAQLGHLRFDYAYLFGPAPLGDTQRIGLLVGF